MWLLEKVMRYLFALLYAFHYERGQPHNETRKQIALDRGRTDRISLTHDCAPDL